MQSEPQAPVQQVTDRRDLCCRAELAEKDLSIYRAALGCKADALITVDHRDFGTLMNRPERTDGLLIQTVADFF